MSDIQEEQKRLYKRAEENDYIVKDIAQYEENDSELAKYTILELQNRINKAIEYTNQFINFKTSRIDEWENVELVLETIVSLLKGDNK